MLKRKVRYTQHSFNLEMIINKNAKREKGSKIKSEKYMQFCIQLSSQCCL